MPSGDSNTSTDEVLTACEGVMRIAANVDDLRDTVEDIDPSIQICKSLEELSAASTKFPDALGGVDPKIFVTNRCKYEPELADTAICKSLSE